MAFKRKCSRALPALQPPACFACHACHACRPPPALPVRLPCPPCPPYRFASMRLHEGAPRIACGGTSKVCAGMCNTACKPPLLRLTPSSASTWLMHKCSSATDPWALYPGPGCYHGWQLVVTFPSQRILWNLKLSQLRKLRNGHLMEPAPAT